MGGQFAPNGQGIRVDGGYCITGAWNFGSGTGHSQLVCAGFIPMVDGAPEIDDAGDVVLLTAVIPRDEIAFTDGWFVQGLTSGPRSTPRRSSSACSTTTVGSESMAGRRWRADRG